MIIAPYFLAVSTYRTCFPQYKLCGSPKKSNFFFLQAREASGRCFGPSPAASPERTTPISDSRFSPKS